MAYHHLYARPCAGCIALQGVVLLHLDTLSNHSRHAEMLDLPQPIGQMLDLPSLPPNGRGASTATSKLRYPCKGKAAAIMPCRAASAHFRQSHPSSAASHFQVVCRALATWQDRGHDPCLDVSGALMAGTLVRIMIACTPFIVVQVAPYTGNPFQSNPLFILHSPTSFHTCTFATPSP